MIFPEAIGFGQTPVMTPIRVRYDADAATGDPAVRVGVSRHKSNLRDHAVGSPTEVVGGPA